jgi:hypothetical protein
MFNAALRKNDPKKAVFSSQKDPTKMVVNVQINATESPPANDENDAHRPRRTKDDILNPEKVKEEKLRSRDVLDDVLNAVRVYDDF